MRAFAQRARHRGRRARRGKRSWWHRAQRCLRCKRGVAGAERAPSPSCLPVRNAGPCNRSARRGAHGARGCATAARSWERAEKSTRVTRGVRPAVPTAGSCFCLRGGSRGALAPSRITRRHAAALLPCTLPPRAPLLRARTTRCVVRRSGRALHQAAGRADGLPPLSRARRRACTARRRTRMAARARPRAARREARAPPWARACAAHAQAAPRCALALTLPRRPVRRRRQAQPGERRRGRLATRAVCHGAARGRAPRAGVAKPAQAGCALRA